MIRQATDAARFCSERGVCVLQSSDVAADVYAPWRLPTRAVLYVPGFLDFTAAGFTPATEDAHTLEVIVPADPTLWRTVRAVSGAAALVDPVIAVHDVVRSPAWRSRLAAKDVGDLCSLMTIVFEHRGLNWTTERLDTSRVRLRPRCPDADRVLASETGGG